MRGRFNSRRSTAKNCGKNICNVKGTGTGLERGRVPASFVLIEFV